MKEPPPPDIITNTDSTLGDIEIASISSSDVVAAVSYKPSSSSSRASSSGEEQRDEEENPADAFKHFAASVAILAGTAVGSGCLAIPRATAPAGVIPSSAAMTIVWVFLCFSALCIVESVEATSRKMKRKDVPLHVVAEQTLGKKWAKMVGFSYVLAVNAALCSSLSKGGYILVASTLGKEGGLNMLAGWAYCAAVWFIGVLLAIPAFVDGGKIAENVNSVATSVMVLAFVGLLTIAEERIFQSSKGVVAETIAKKDWSKVLKSVPAIFQTLSFHFVVPVVCTKLHHEKKRCRLAVIFGSAIPLVMTLLWNFAATFLRITPSAANVISPVVNVSPTDAVSAAAAATNNIAAAIVDRNRNRDRIGGEYSGNIGRTGNGDDFDLIDSPSLSPSDVEDEFNKEKTTTTTTTVTTTKTSALTPEEYNKIREMAREEEKRGSGAKDEIVREEVREIIGVAQDIAASADTSSTRTTTTLDDEGNDGILADENNSVDSIDSGEEIITSSSGEEETVSPKDIIVEKDENDETVVVIEEDVEKTTPGLDEISSSSSTSSIDGGDSSTATTSQSEASKTAPLVTEKETNNALTALATVFEGETPKPESIVKEETPQLVEHTVKALMSDPKEALSNKNAKEMLAFEQALISDKSKLDEFVEKGGEEWNSALESDIDDTFANLNGENYVNEMDATSSSSSATSAAALEKEEESLLDDGIHRRRRNLLWKIKIRRVFHHHRHEGDDASKPAPIDPVQALLESGGTIVEVFVWLFAGSAVVTTIIGSYLSLASAFQAISYDFGYGCGVFARRSRKAFRKKSLALFSNLVTSNPFAPATGAGSDHHSIPTKNECEYYGQFFIVVAAVAPSVIVACHGPELFYGVVKFSGGFIIPLLYLLAPAMMVRATRTGHCLTGLVDLDAYKNVVTDEDERKAKDPPSHNGVVKASPPFGLDAPIWKERDRSTPMTWGGDFGLLALAAVSVGLVLANTYSYLVAVL